MPGTNQFHFNFWCSAEWMRFLSCLVSLMVGRPQGSIISALSFSRLVTCTWLNHKPIYNESDVYWQSSFSMENQSCFPILKEDDPLDTSNYRPISVIPACTPWNFLKSCSYTVIWFHANVPNFIFQPVGLSTQALHANLSCWSVRLFAWQHERGLSYWGCFFLT